MLRMEISLIDIHLLIGKLSLTMSKRRNILIVNWTCWHISGILALNGISYGYILIVDIGGVGSAIDGLILLLLNLSLRVVDGMDLHAVYCLGLVWDQSAVVRHEGLEI